MHMCNRPGHEHPLRRWRAQNGVTLVEVAGLSGIHASVISRIERGEIRPRPITKIRISRALGCPIGDIFPPDPPRPRRAGRPTTKAVA